MRHPDLERLVESDPSWPYEAYEFVLSSLDLASQDFQENHTFGLEEDSDESSASAESGKHSGSSHVDGRQIALAARKLAQDEFGQMATVVFSQWRIRSTMDLGSIIFKLIEIGLLNKNENDSVADFEGVYSIPGELLDGFEIQIHDI